MQLLVDHPMGEQLVEKGLQLLCLALSDVRTPELVDVVFYRLVQGVSYR